ncbi:hypothetical protein TcarDRAFT_2382 [Thermosinus carboxydivorans Nor1]|uniref:DUF3967 domain-containing protein n=1 Tax=Thermosinus carboxydivorans Nor1 TaxID=401526 RepID=A1HNT0_9FIRM|nr:hypothetical protein [Thermosinus carboxydivorans]EAX48432.1 hypothetical protein TcarDRAFT_2382 [Thermosinus carboxydivorans Nor1]
MRPKNIEYQNGMFILSNSDDVTKLVRNLRNKPLDEYAHESVEVTNVKSQSEILEKITAHLQTIEEKLQLMEGSFAAVLRQTLEDQENERISAMEKITVHLQTIEERMQLMESSFVAILRQALEDQESERKKVEVEWQQELAERDRRLLAEIGAMLGKTVEGQQSAWWQKLFATK